MNCGIKLKLAWLRGSIMTNKILGPYTNKITGPYQTAYHFALRRESAIAILGDRVEELYENRVSLPLFDLREDTVVEIRDWLHEYVFSGSVPVLDRDWCFDFNNGERTIIFSFVDMNMAALFKLRFG